MARTTIILLEMQKCDSQGLSTNKKLHCMLNSIVNYTKHEKRLYAASVIRDYIIFSQVIKIGDFCIGGLKYVKVHG